MTTAPLLDQRVVEATVALELRMAAKDPHGRTPRRLLLVHGTYAPDSPAELTVEGRRVVVRSGASVLGMYEAWHAHLAAADTDALLVLATPLSDEQISLDLRAQAMHREIRRVDRWQLVRQRFGVRELDNRLRGSAKAWLADALLAAEPADGWPRTGAAVLDYDAALRNLVRARFGLRSDTLDAEELLIWSLDADAAQRHTRLGEDERRGIRTWLTETVGAPARVLFTLADAHHASDAMAAGVLGTVLWNPALAADPDVARVAGRVETLFRGAPPAQADLHAFASAVGGVLLRWIGEAAGNGPRSAWARRHAEHVLDQAETLSREHAAQPLAVRNRLLRSGFHARLRALAEPLAAGRVAESVQALADAAEHEYATLEPSRLAPARMAVRLLNWLDTTGSEQPGGELPATVAAGIDAHLNDLGWVDRALITLRAGDPVPDDAIAAAYRAVAARVQTRRDEFDHAFARRLAAWSPHAAPGAGLLGVEDVLTRIAAPLAAGGKATQPGAPLLLVLDGMSSAVAVELAEQIRDEGWTEVSTAPGRKAALAMIPSITRISRATLLSGAAASGGQQTETEGFTRYWKQHRRTAALFHKGDIAGPDGARLADPLLRALSDSKGVVAVVLNTIDDALDKDRTGERTGWRVDDITYLDLLLDSARGYGRPIVLAADHGHVLHRGADQPTRAGAPSARWRTGEPGDGEITLTGPRVLENGGSVVVPWRDDIRYTQKHAGYHGGASLAEMTVPVLAFVPDRAMPPDGWHVLAEEDTTPPWWTRAAPGPSAAEPAQAPARTRPKPKRPAAAPPQEDALFAAPETPATAPPAPAAASLGARLIASPVYRNQLATIRRQPKDERVAAVVDALAAAGGSLSSTKTIEVMGSNAARMDGTFATLTRLLNVEQYPVLMLIDAGRTARLDIPLLREQFGV